MARSGKLLRASLALAALALLAAAPAHAQDVPGETPPAEASPFDGNAMWIWRLPRAGTWEQIAARARANNISALYIKNADGGSSDWAQFTPEMVRYFHSQGLKVCGWHYIYGRYPAAEASLSARAIRDGADCFIIDAEAEYEGRYAAADTYITRLRRLVGTDTPIALAGFPYVHFHGRFPYSVFMRPDGGAEYNLPQMYWKAIGTTVDDVYRVTYRWNTIYGRPIFPLGQIWQNPSASELRRFRLLAQAYGARGISWWEWSQGTSASFRRATKQIQPTALVRTEPAATVGRGTYSRGDWVVWAQEHLNGAGHSVPVTGTFGAQTQLAVRDYQTAEGLPVTGAIDDLTWKRLLEETPVATRWAHRSGTRRAPASARTASASTKRGEFRAPNR